MEDRRKDHSLILEEIKLIHGSIKTIDDKVGIIEVKIDTLQPATSLITMINSGGMFAKWATKNVTPWAVLVGIVLAIIKFLK